MTTQSELCSNLLKIKDNFEQYHCTKTSLEMVPPIFFHEKAIKLCDKDFLSDNHIEAIYAVLVAWGMNRAGEKGAKMPPYHIFKESILRNKWCIENLKEYRIEQIECEDKFKEILKCLTCLCFNIQATKCSSKLVSSSKTLAHILPNLVCPIDNLYTLTFFKDGLKKKNEMEKFQYIITQMWLFYKCVKLSKIKVGLSFAHSYPKIFDNLIIEYVKQNNLLNTKQS